jgi:hypothetical protein
VDGLQTVIRRNFPARRAACCSAEALIVKLAGSGY